MDGISRKMVMIKQLFYQWTDIRTGLGGAGFNSEIVRWSPLATPDGNRMMQEEQCVYNPRLVHHIIDSYYRWIALNEFNKMVM